MAGSAMTTLPPDSTTARRTLDAFLVDNEELEQLTARLSAFPVGSSGHHTYLFR